MKCKPSIQKDLNYNWLITDHLKVKLHFPSDDVGVVNDNHLFARLDGLQGVPLAALVCILKLVRVEVIIA